MELLMSEEKGRRKTWVLVCTYPKGVQITQVPAYDAQDAFNVCMEVHKQQGLDPDDGVLWYVGIGRLGHDKIDDVDAGPQA